MAQLTITVPDDQIALISEAFAHNYNNTKPVIPTDPAPTPNQLLQIKGRFVKEEVMRYVQETVKNYLDWKARQAASTTPDTPLTLA